MSIRYDFKAKEGAARTFFCAWPRAKRPVVFKTTCTFVRADQQKGSAERIRVGYPWFSVNM